MDSGKLREQILAGKYDGTFARLYPRKSAEECRKRYADAIDAFETLFGQREAVLISAPGRTEVCGNHTDHQRGMVLAAAVDLDILCVAAPNNDSVIRVQSKGYPRDEIDLNDLSPQQKEREKAVSLIRGVAAWFQNHGYKIGGFNAYTTSDVLSGSGLSSSAAFEVALGNTLKALYAPAVTPEELAMAGQYAENEYFGKPSGLMDQMASSVGGFVQMDFADPAKPLIHPVSFDLTGSGLNLCIVDTKGSHADLTAEYAAIPPEMAAVAACFGKRYLREVDEAAFLGDFAAVRAKTGDRAVLRAMHFFEDNSRIPQMTHALENGDAAAFLSMITDSGHSSFMRLQNVIPSDSVREQELAVALAWSERLLAEGGGWRVHGGGFAGTIQAFVPDRLLDGYRAQMDAVFGEGACHVLSVRGTGGAQIHPEGGDR